MKNNKTWNLIYDILKWIILIVMPAVATLVGTIGTAVGWVDTELFLVIWNAVTVFLGVSLGISNGQFKKSNDVIIEPKG